MGIATGTADAVTIDTIGGWAMVVARGARKQIATRSMPVEVARRGIATHPTRWVRTSRVQPDPAHPTLQMTAVARLWGMAGHASAGLGLCLESVTREEVRRVRPLPLEGFGVALLYETRLCHVVAVVALLLRVAALAELRLSRGIRSVQCEEATVVTNERTGDQLLDLQRIVTGRARSSVEFLLVLVTLKTAIHRREKSTLRSHHAAVAGHALPSDPLHPQVLLVVELDLIRGGDWFALWAEGPLGQLLGILLMAGRASLDARAFGTGTTRNVRRHSASL